MDWNGFCSYCGKRGHGPRDCWTKQRDEAGGEGGKGAGPAFVEDDGGIDDGIGEINGFDIAALDKDEESERQEVVRRRSRTNSSRLPKSAPDPRARHQRGGWGWLEQGLAGAHHDRFRGGRVGNSAGHVAGGANQAITRVACRDALHRRQRRENAEPTSSSERVTA